MEIDEHGCVDDKRRRPCHPGERGETQGPWPSAGKDAARPGDEEKDHRDPKAAQERDDRGEHVAAIVFRTPRVWRQSLEPMENETHPEPAREDRKNSGDRA